MYTGNTFIAPEIPPLTAVYPCVYREHLFVILCTDSYAGLSLCIQGTLNHLYISDFFAPVYPCVYREHTKWQSSGFTGIGLSLCIQGTQEPPPPTPLNMRFIPVYTGNTILISTLRKIPPVYPCVYREHTNN